MEQDLKKAKGFFGWIGGKSRLAKTLIETINQQDHSCYVEVFAGAAHVFFRKQEVKTEIINDINSDIINLYRILQNHLEEFCRYFKWVLVSREEFDRLNRVEATTLTDIQRAARFYYLQKSAFGGRPHNRTFGTATTSKPRMNLLRIEEDLSAAHLRLARVTIENLKWQEILQRYDREHTLFYLDPPYYDCENYYGKGLFKRDEFVEMAEILKSIKGKFVLSLNDKPEVRALFQGFNIQPVSVGYSCGTAAHRRQFEEVIITKG